MMSVRKVEDAYQISLKEEENLARKKSQRGRGKIQNEEKGVDPMTRHIKPRMIMRNHTVTQKEVKVPKGDKVVEEVLLEEEEEAEEER
jgi:hypothetical protein